MVVVIEKDVEGVTHTVHIDSKTPSSPTYSSVLPAGRGGRAQLRRLFAEMFLPAGYPESVSPDYLHYQIYNCVQAFCSSLASLIASRATLEGFGVGDSSASATHALLLTILQDVFSRLSTILGAYYIGTSLVPEAKTYRFLADILNDAAIILDSLSPLLTSSLVPAYLPSSTLRVAALCLSGSLRAACGIAAGGSKAALTVHFAMPGRGTGDVGDLNAKDASKETVLGLTGMLLGTLVVPCLTTRQSTWAVLILLLTSHLIANYVAVRGVVLRSLNRQRTALAWMLYRRAAYTEGNGAGDHAEKVPAHSAPSPQDVAKHERILDVPGSLSDPIAGHRIGACTIGSSFSSGVVAHETLPALLRVFERERYVLCVNPKSLSPASQPHFHICLKEGHSPQDHLKAWMHATEACLLWAAGMPPVAARDGTVDVLRRSYETVGRFFEPFMAGMRGKGWNMDEFLLMPGQPKFVLVRVDEGGDLLVDEIRDHSEDKKTQ